MEILRDLLAGRDRNVPGKPDIQRRNNPFAGDLRPGAEVDAEHLGVDARVRPGAADHRQALPEQTLYGVLQGGSDRRSVRLNLIAAVVRAGIAQSQKQLSQNGRLLSGIRKSRE